MPGDPAVMDPPLRPAADEWLALGLGPDATTEATRLALLRRLAAAHYVPDPLTHEAALIAVGTGGGSAPLLAAQGTAASQEATRRVAEFAATFFAIPVAERRATWLALGQATAGDEAAQARLRRLEPGLTIDLAAVTDPDPLVQRLAGDLLELFPLDPRVGTALAREKLLLLCRDPRSTFRSRSRARRALLRRHPSVAALSRGYLVELARPRRSAEANRRRAWSSSFFQRDYSSFDINTKAAGPWLVIVVLMGLFRTFLSHQETSPRPTLPTRLTAVAPARVPNAIGLPDVQRYQLRNAIERALNEAAIRPTAGQLREIALAVPLDAGAGSLSAAALLGQPTPQDIAILADVLIRQLQRTGTTALPADRAVVVARQVLRSLAAQFPPRSLTGPVPSPPVLPSPRGQP